MMKNQKLAVEAQTEDLVTRIPVQFTAASLVLR